MRQRLSTMVGTQTTEVGALRDSHELPQKHCDAYWSAKYWKPAHMSAHTCVVANGPSSPKAPSSLPFAPLPLFIAAQQQCL